METPTYPPTREKRLAELAGLELSMLRDLDCGFQWKDLAATLDKVETEARELGLPVDKIMSGEG